MAWFTVAVPSGVWNVKAVEHGGKKPDVTPWDVITLHATCSIMVGFLVL